MLTLGIETSCDETACSIVLDGKQILSNVVSSQIDLHAEYGGVVPELACRRHIDVLLPVIKESLSLAQVSLKQIDLIAVASGPGLIGALLIGLNAAKGLALSLQKPFIGVNHVEAHLYAALMSNTHHPKFPCLGVILSGGHTSLVLMTDSDQFSLISQTVDDAIGEAFDKVAKLMGLPYPGGPEIERLAKNGDAQRFPFKGGKVKNNPLGFSFSGLKTAVLYTIKGQNQADGPLQLTEDLRCSLAASFQRAVFEDLIKKTVMAANQYGIKEIIFGGGVTNNRKLREEFGRLAQGYTLLWPDFELSLDNAAMIAGLGTELYRRRGHGDGYALEALSRI